MFPAANTFESEYRKVGFDFVEVAAVPISQFTLFIEKCNRPPFALVVDEFGA